MGGRGLAPGFGEGFGLDGPVEGEGEGHVVEGAFGGEFLAHPELDLAAREA